MESKGVKTHRGRCKLIALVNEIEGYLGAEHVHYVISTDTLSVCQRAVALIRRDIDKKANVRDDGTDGGEKDPK